MSKDKRYCPFFKQECVTNQCEIYNDKLNTCSIPLLTYNAYRLSESLNNYSEGGLKGKSGSGIPDLPDASFGRM